MRKKFTIALIVLGLSAAFASESFARCRGCHRHPVRSAFHRVFHR